MNNKQLLQESPPKAALMAIAAWQLIPVMDGIAKYLTDFVPILQVVWARFVFHLLIVVPLVIARHGTSSFKVQRPVLQVARGGFLLVATATFFTAVHYVPLADAAAVLFLAPILVVILGGWILGETVRFIQYVAVALGFVGALIIQKPGFEGFHPASLLLIVTAFSFAAFALSTRALAGSAPPLVTLAYQSVLGVVVMSAIMPFVWEPPDLKIWTLMLGLGVIASISHLLLIKAHEIGAASRLAPLGYSEILMALFIGYIVFGDFPDSVTWVGIGCVLFASLMVSWPGKGK